MKHVIGVLLLCCITATINGCPRPKQLPSSICARLYQHSHIACGGAYRNAYKQEFVSNMGSDHDHASAVVVRPGCRLEVYEHINYRGRGFRLGSHYNYAGAVVSDLSRYNFNDLMSSYICTCKPTKK